MNTTTAIPMPTDRQFGFIDSLLNDRQVPQDLADKAAAERLTMSRKEASALIDRLLGCPKKPKAAAPATENPWKAVKEVLTPEYAEVKDLLATLPKSRYAIPTEGLIVEDMVGNITGSLYFMEIKEYKGTRYARKLTGAPGAFNRTKIATKDLLVFLKILADDPYRYTKMYGQHYSCCGKCGAELTDDKSRELNLGPECRKYFGF